MILPHDFTWVLDDQALADLCTLCATREAVFIDTEFVRRTTFFAKLGLIQIASGEQYYLVDPLGINDWQPLKALLTDAAVVKVMHACSEDVDVFYCLLGVLPAPLFDTQIACALAGLDYGMGFAKMVAHFCDIELDKGETNSDWMARPLTEKQCQYAVADVVWLVPCYRQLMQKLQDLKRVDWVIEDGAHMVASHVCVQPPESLYKRMKGIGNLTPRQLAVAKNLCAWRDATSRDLDRPKSRVIKDADLIFLAKRQPTAVYDFEEYDDFGYGWIKRFAKPALVAIHQALATNKDELPQLQDYERSSKALLGAMREQVSAAAKQLAIPDTALAGKKDLLSLIASINQDDTLNPDMSGWRKPVVGDRLEQLIRDF